MLYEKCLLFYDYIIFFQWTLFYFSFFLKLPISLLYIFSIYTLCHHFSFSFFGLSQFLLNTFVLFCSSLICHPKLTFQWWADALNSFHWWQVFLKYSKRKRECNFIFVSLVLFLNHYFLLNLQYGHPITSSIANLLYSAS